MKKFRLAIASFLILLLIGCGGNGHDPTDPPITPKPGTHVRVHGNKILSPAGSPVFLKVATWENPYEGRVSEATIKKFMDYMWARSLNCILLKGNMWLIHDDRTRNQHNINTMHRLIKYAEARNIYVMLNLFDVWSRGRGSNQFNVNPATHPINVWDWDQRGAAATYIKWVTREFIKHPMVLFELGNEMEKNGADRFIRVAKKHLLPHFYAIAGRDRPIGVSQRPLWVLPVNVIFNHNPRNMPGVNPGDRPIITNELAYDTDLWKDSTIRNPSRSQEYYSAFALATRKGHSGVAAATIIDINKPITGSADIVLTRLGQLK